MSDPIILAIDTATEACSVAVNGVAGVVEECQVAANAHSQLLLPMISRILQRAGLVLGDLDAIACGVGPGGFTGVRIGVSTAQALAMARGLPVYPVSSLQALAAATVQPSVLTALDARKGEVYAAVYVQDERTGLPVLQGEERVCPPGAVAWPHEGGYWGLGSAWPLYHSEWQQDNVLGWTEDAYPQAEAVLRLALARHLRGEDGCRPDQLEPHYIRPFLPQDQQK
ncbi:tRNA (adenosine(37)-N6)-threonylcarbamoyltransferase complex dimerization subunit type 1 TsaB [Acidithiobacillus sp.]|uniref:tRNA (adenosine(37)-N6)-threonylcarbamoyltransferase complex dimerization subunit type 1 TsaB n=1 Tax=Acidithiobacillus sp. TaxID=1872118 RepID=UPI00262929CD|nr:tRNA (adenosine(37)-N6)-threonylcarbamoyltransferase complex dimerization subunit type 1 TsaB [Acidithiobacillus sp.]MDD2750618.1 tRNA (adenosine(37)-N6)-threonylcarbamoyltransferase complex dimerization subunit type 1 TsaB [Acidithiobacillus sp.]MDD5278928.1 tRNA (adenosine(37)-N6)-threonylcarbamoyltransferase complex dimerization subunit type 1 TsaB [Acidithiobacillus sp.]